jgi:hypothetical protein
MRSAQNVARTWFLNDNKISVQEIKEKVQASELEQFQI